MKHGRQEPTKSVILPYKTTHGGAAVKLYTKTEKTAFTWQRRLLNAILSTGKDKLWIHSKFGFSVPRRNGKNEIVVMRELYGLIVLGERVLHTAHRVTTARVGFERLLRLLEKVLASYPEIQIDSVYRAEGREHVFLTNGACIYFRTRTRTGGLGEGYDLMVIDEAQEYQDEQEATLKYVVSDSKNPQTILIGTPPTPQSSGTVFTAYRNAVISGETSNNGWAEWSVNKESDIRDKSLWYETNPSLGLILRELAVFDEVGKAVIDFNIQRLGLWLTYNLKSAISRIEWEALKIKGIPEFVGKMNVGVRFGQSTVSLSIAIKTSDENKIFVEAIDCRPLREGTAWILDFILTAKKSISKIIIDGANGQGVLSEELEKEKVKGVVLPTVKDVITANAAFEQAVFLGGVCHSNQPALSQSVSNCEKRAIGTAGGFGYRSIHHDVEITLMESAIFSYWGATHYKESTNTQKISY